MIKKLFSFALILTIVLSMTTVFNNVDANTQNTDVIANVVEKTAPNTATNLSKVQYAITEAPGPIEVIHKEELPEVVVIEEKNLSEKINRIIDPIKPMIAITFDDGPSQYTPEILDSLKENNSAATFFVLGSQVNNNKDILIRMLEEGNQIGNHTYNHKKLTTISDEELYKQIQGTDDLIYAATGYTTSIMRPPYGATNTETNKKISKPIINWSIDTRDWENRNTNIIVNSILENVKDGDIILMHDLYDATVQASKIVIPELVNRGYQLVTLEELFEYREVYSKAGVQYYNLYK